MLVCGLIAYLYLRGHIFIWFAESFCPSGWLFLQSFFFVFKDGVANPYVNVDKMCECHQYICIPSPTLDSFRALRVKSHQAIRKVCYLLSKFTITCVLSLSYLTYLPASVLVQIFAICNVLPIILCSALSLVQVSHTQLSLKYCFINHYKKYFIILLL